MIKRTEDFNNRMIELLDDERRYNQLIVSDYLFQLMRVRKGSVVDLFMNVDGVKTLPYKNGMTITLLPIDKVIEVLSTPVGDGPEQQYTDGIASESTISLYGGSANLYTVLKQTFGETFDESGAFLVGDYYPFFVMAFKSTVTTVTTVKPTIELFKITLVESGLFHRINETKFQYGYSTPLNEL